MTVDWKYMLDTKEKENFVKNQFLQKISENVKVNVFENIKISVKGEIFSVKFSIDRELKESDLEIFYENRMIKIVFDNKYSRYGTNKLMKAVDGSLVFRVYIPDPCSEKDFDIVHNVIYNILGVAVI